MDLSKFSDEQLLIASKIIEESKKTGIDPNLALAVASSESGFNPTAKSEKNAIGVMQLLPSTAKSLNVDPHDVDENIRGGIQYLKQNLDRFGDVNKALAAYNSGPGSKFFQTGDIKDLPDETLEYISRINSIYEPTPSKDKGAEEKGEKTEGQKTEKPEEDNSFDRAIAGGAGAITGLTLGKAFPDKGLAPQSMAGLERKQIGQQALLSELEKELSRIPESARRAPSLTPNAPPVSLDIPEAPDSQTGLERQLQGTIEDGQTGRARQTGYQELTAQQAARQREMAETENMLRQRGVISGRSPFLNFPIASSPTGILVPPGVAAEAAIPEAQAQAQTQQANQLEKQISDTRRNLAVTQQTIAELNRRAPGPLAKAGAIFRSPAAKMIPGIGAGLGVEEAKRRYESGDYPGAVLAGSGALGSGLMMLPTAPGPVGAATKGLGALMGYGGGLGLFLRDLLLRKQEEQAARSQISATR